MTRASILTIALVAALHSVPSLAQDVQYNTLPIHYEIRADLDPARGQLSASATIDMKARVDAPAEIVLGYDVAFSASAVFDADGAPLTYTQWKDSEYAYIQIDFPNSQAVRTGDVLTLRVDYSGIVDRYVREVNTISEEITELGQALMWYPRDLDYAASDITFSCDITAPDEQQIFVPPALALLTDKRRENGRTTWVFETTGETDWTMILVASKDLKSFESASRGIRGEIYYVRSSEEQARQLFDNVVSVLATFESSFGAYGERPFFRYLLSPRDGWSYMRGRTAFMPEGSVAGAIDERGVLARRTYAYLAHELAHLWWGGAVQPAPEEAHPNSDWLSEGFAEFSSMVAVEANIGPDAARDVRESWIKNIIKHESSPPVTGATRERCTDWYHWRDVTYYKAALALSMMRDEMGSDAFFSMMRDWTADHLGKAVTTAEFLAHTSTCFDEFDRFTDQWLLGSDVPVVSVSYRTEKRSKGFAVSGLVRQRGAVFSFPLEIRLRGSADSTLLRLSCTERDTGFRLELDFEPVELEVDPSHRVLLRRNRG